MAGYVLNAACIPVSFSYKAFWAAFRKNKIIVNVLASISVPHDERQQEQRSKANQSRVF